ncbi:PASTA domain-containing protein [Nonomuraea sp. NPDC049637]|uniref:protein kinase domain-containing protein n=1 Tax=Nonomuraea sp. NPDC049637 TaxID=3154356 RepID=UPI003443256F
MPTAQPLRTGDPHRLGEYELAGRLGEGGQGAVFLGSRGGERYAVKLLHGPVGDEQGAFLREVELAKHVARFCTAQVIDAGFDEGRPYIVSEYVDGPSLHREVSLTGPRHGGALERLAVGTATALAAIHRAGIVHRDFKPQNVLLGPDGPRVIDFGLARALDAAATVTNRGVGTPAYMAPEQITASAVTGAADVFSWGATMCFAANASAPFGQDSVAPVLHRILTAPPELGRLDGRLRVLVAACLDKDVRNRPSSRELLLALLGEPDAPDRGYGDVPLVPGQRPPVPLAEPEVTGAAGAYHLRSRTGAGPEPPTSTGPTTPPDPTAPVEPGPRRPRAPYEPGPPGPRAPYESGARGPRTPDEPDGLRTRAGTGATDRRGRGAGWVQAVVAVCAALLVTAVVLTVIVPALNGHRSGQASVLPAAPPSPAGSAHSSSRPGGKPAERQRVPTVAPAVEPTVEPTGGPTGGPTGEPTAGRPVTVAVPPLTGMDRAAAVKALKQAGLTVGAVTRTDSPREIGRVLGSRPAAGTVVGRGGAVALEVSAGVPVPSLIGRQRKAAEAALTAAGLAAGTVTRACSDQPDGQVLATRPEAGARLPGGATVALTVARQGVEVPSVVGRPRADGRAALVAAGFTVRSRAQVVDDDAKADTVLSQSLTPGACAAPGDVVVITVGVAGQSGGPGPEEPTQTPTGPATDPSTGL